MISLTSNPRLTTILRIRDSGPETRSSTTRSSQGAGSSQPPEQSQPEQAQATGQPSSQQDPDSFLGSDEPDWQAYLLGFDSRAQYRMVDRKVAGVQRQLRLVEGNGICLFASLRRLMAVAMEYTNQHMRREVVFHVATHVAEYEQDLIPLIRGIHGAGDPLTTPQSVCSYLQDLQQTNFWAYEIVLRVLSIIYKLTIAVIRGNTGREERVCHNRELSEVVLTRRGHYSPAGKFLHLYLHIIYTAYFCCNYTQLFHHL